MRVAAIEKQALRCSVAMLCVRYLLFDRWEKAA